jgi:predicted aspartyl protease
MWGRLCNMTSFVPLSLVLIFAGQINNRPAPVYAAVSIGSQGPYRFLVDTGSQTSVIDSALAARLQLKPEFRVEMITQNTTRLRPALKVKTLRIGQKALPETEMVLDDAGDARRMDSSVVGILGINALRDLDFSLRPGKGRMEVGGARPAGEAVSLRRVEDRLAVQARMGDENLTFLLDSGATHVVLFRTPRAMAATKPLSATFGTLEGARLTVPTCWTADMEFTRLLKFGTLPAAIVTRPGTEVDGLLPASLFREIYVDQTRGELVLIR